MGDEANFGIRNSRHKFRNTKLLIQPTRRMSGRTMIGGKDRW